MKESIKIAGKEYLLKNKVSTYMKIMEVWNAIYMGLLEASKEDKDKVLVNGYALSASQKMNQRLRHTSIKESLQSEIIPNIFFYWTIRQLIEAPQFKKPSIRFMLKEIEMEEYKQLLTYISENILGLQADDEIKKKPARKKVKK